MNVIDIVCLALILVIAIIGAKKGIFIVFVQFLALAVSGVAARSASGPVSDYIYTQYVQFRVTERLNGLLPAGSVSGGIQRVIESVVKSLPENVYKVADFLHLIPSASESTSEILSVAQIESQYVAPILTKVLSFITMAVIFIVLSVILRLIVHAIDKALFKKENAISTANKVGGFILGVIKGVIPVVFICVILNLIAPVINNDVLIELVSGSYLCNFIAGILN